MQLAVLKHQRRQHSGQGSTRPTQHQSLHRKHTRLLHKAEAANIALQTMPTASATHNNGSCSSTGAEQQIFDSVRWPVDVSML